MNQLAKLPVFAGLGLFLLALFVFALPIVASQPVVNFWLRKDERTGARSTSNPSLVKDLFRNNCARCHGIDGRGDTPLGHTYNTPDFTNADWWRKHENITRTGSLVSIVSRGKGGMPAFGNKLTRAQIPLLVKRVRKFKP